MAKILIVDDEPQILELLSIVLTRAGHEVHTAGDPHKALDICSQPASFDLVLCDVAMPMMDGHEVTRWMAAHSPGCRVILMSAFDSGCEACPYPSGCEMVRKPFDPQEVVRRIAAALEQSPRRSAESSQALYPQIRSQLLRQLVEAREALERASDQLSRLDLLRSDEELGDDVVPLQEQAKKLRSAALKVYLLAAQRYKDFQDGRLARGATPQD
jgi:DNA-binding NtrC family response regulator